MPVSRLLGRHRRSPLFAMTLLALLTACQHLPETAAPPSDKPASDAPEAVASKPGAAADKTAASDKAAPTEANAFEQSQTYYQVLLSQLAQQRGEPQIALSNLLAAAESSRDVSLARQAFGLALKQRDADATLRAATLLADLESTNPEARIALGLAQLQSEQHEAAKQSVQTALALIGSNEEGQLGLLGKFARAGGPPSLPLLAELAREHPRPEWVLLAAAVQAQHFGDGPYAMALLDRAIEQAPTYRRAVLVKAELLANRDGEAAIALLDEVYRQQPDDPELALAYGRTLYSQGRFPEAVTVLQPHLDSDAADAKDISYLYAVSLFMAGDWAAAQPRLQRIAEAGEQTGPAGWLCAQAAERLNRPKQALACYDRVQPGDGQYLPANRAKAELLSKQGQHDAALATLTETRRALDALDGTEPETKIRQQASLLASQLRVLQQAGRIAEAKQLYEQDAKAYREQLEPALLAASLGQPSPTAQLAAFRELRPASQGARQQWALTCAGLLQEQELPKLALTLLNEELTEQKDNVELLYARALLAEPLGQHEQTEADLRRVLALDPNHIDALNALGYTLADHNRQLDEAYDLIQRALRARPTSAAIMDSVGWVHYRRGELAEARNWLGRAYALEPEAEIAAHYGEVLYQAGDKKKARQIWRDALTHSPSNAVLKATMERLK